MVACFASRQILPTNLTYFFGNVLQNRIRRRGSIPDDASMSVAGLESYNLFESSGHDGRWDLQQCEHLVALER